MIICIIVYDGWSIFTMLASLTIFQKAPTVCLCPSFYSLGPRDFCAKKKKTSHFLPTTPLKPNFHCQITSKVSDHPKKRHQHPFPPHQLAHPKPHPLIAPEAAKGPGSPRPWCTRLRPAALPPRGRCRWTRPSAAAASPGEVGPLGPPGHPGLPPWWICVSICG